jgi:glycosyltransferase involved in cell wall biosynthesis
VNRISVVIPNHNYGRFVSDAVEAALSQTHPPFEVIVVDNGSTDDSLEVLRKFGNRIRVIAQENRGQSGARNRGVEEAGGDWIAFCDADDAWLSGKLERQIAVSSGAEVGLVYCGYSEADKDLKPFRHVELHRGGKLLEHFAHGSASVIPAGESSVLIRRKFLLEVGGFDPELSVSGGFDLYRRICQSYEARVVPEPQVLYRQHGNNTSRRTREFARDYLAALEKMFRDPKASSLCSRRRSCLGRAHMSIAGAYWRSRQVVPFVSHAVRALFYSPAEARELISYPLRLVRGRL